MKLPHEALESKCSGKHRRQRGDGIVLLTAEGDAAWPACSLRFFDTGLKAKHKGLMPLGRAEPSRPHTTSLHFEESIPKCKRIASAPRRIELISKLVFAKMSATWHPRDLDCTCFSPTLFGISQYPWCAAVFRFVGCGFTRIPVLKGQQDSTEEWVRALSSLAPCRCVWKGASVSGAIAFLRKPKAN